MKLYISKMKLFKTNKYLFCLFLVQAFLFAIINVSFYGSSFLTMLKIGKHTVDFVFFSLWYREVISKSGVSRANIINQTQHNLNFLNG